MENASGSKTHKPLSFSGSPDDVAEAKQLVIQWLERQRVKVFGGCSQ